MVRYSPKDLRGISRKPSNASFPNHSSPKVRARVTKGLRALPKQRVQSQKGNLINVIKDDRKSVKRNKSHGVRRIGRTRRREAISTRNRVTVFSVGYEKRSISELINVLRKKGVITLLDVRKLPVSRKSGFSKNGLRLALQTSGIAYRHIGAAGNPYWRTKNNMEDCLDSYRLYLMRRPSIVNMVSAQIHHGKTAILCYERRHDDCHRSVLLQAMIRFGKALSVVSIE